MSFPPGVQGSHPAEPPAAGAANCAAGQRPRVVQILNIVAAGLGVVILLLGFTSAQSASGSTLGAGALDFYGSGLGWIPALFLIGGLLAVPELLPGSPAPRTGVMAAAVSGAAWIAGLFTSFMVSAGFGLVLVLVAGFVQAGAMVTVQLAEFGYVTLPAASGSGDLPGPNSGGFPAPGPQPGPFGQHPPQPGAFPGSPQQRQPGGWNPNSGPAGPPAGQAGPQAPFGQPGQQVPGAPAPFGQAAPQQNPGQTQQPSQPGPFGQPGGWNPGAGGASERGQASSSGTSGGPQGTQQMPHPGQGS